MIWFTKYIRIICYIFTLLLIGSTYAYISSLNLTQSLKTIRLTQVYGFCALGYLYVTLLHSPLYTVFPFLPGSPQWRRARRALGISAWVFALLHASNAFFFQLGGFSGLVFLGSTYIKPIVLSTLALVILSMLAATSFDVAIRKMGKNWKRLHRFVYVAGILVLIHSLMLGTHFERINSLIPVTIYSFVVFLLILEGIRLDRWIQRQQILQIQTSFFFPLWCIAIISVLGYLYIPRGSDSAPVILNVHAQHQKIAEDLVKAQSNPNSSVPQQQSKRYTVSFIPPENITPGREVTLRFKVYDASNGSPVTLFATNFEKLAHLVIVDSSLLQFSHIHPSLDNKEFKVPVTFAEPGVYHLYLDFLPFGSVEQQFAFTLPVGKDPVAVPPQIIDYNEKTKTFGNYEVSMSYEGKLTATDLSLGRTKINFNVKDAETKQPVTDLEPYLGSFGHLVMIQRETYEYIHVHPTNTSSPLPEQKGGPEISFTPLGLYGPTKPGPYALYFQFNHNGTVNTAVFPLEVAP